MSPPLRTPAFRLQSLPGRFVGVVALLLALPWLAGGCQAQCPLSQEPEWLQRHVRDIEEADAYTEYRQLVLSDDELHHAADYVRAHPDETSFFVLLLIRSRSREIYGALSADTRAKVICDAMRELTFLNDWGLLEPEDPYDAAAGKALVEIGAPALLYLRSLLDNVSPALLWGSEEASLTEQYQLRRADYAYRYTMLILGHEPVFHENIELRDQALAELRAELDTTLILPATPCPED